MNEEEIQQQGNQLGDDGSHPAAPVTDETSIPEALPQVRLTKEDLDLIKKDPKKGPIADSLQKLIVKLLKGHRIGVDRSKEMARLVLVRLRDAQDELAIDDAIKESVNEFPEIKPLFYLIEEAEKRDVDEYVADLVIADIEAGKVTEAVDLGNKICHFFRENPEGDVHQLLSHYGHQLERKEHPDISEELS